MYTEYFCPGHKLFFSRNKNYKATTQNRTHIPNILALVRGWNEKLQSYKLKSNIYTEYFCPFQVSKWKTTKLQAEIKHIYWIFLPWSFGEMKNYKTTTQNWTYILDIATKYSTYLQNWGKIGHSLEVSTIFTDFMMISLCFRTAYIKNTNNVYLWMRASWPGLWWAMHVSCLS